MAGLVWLRVLMTLKLVALAVILVKLALKFEMLVLVAFVSLLPSLRLMVRLLLVFRNTALWLKKKILTEV